MGGIGLGGIGLGGVGSGGVGSGGTGSSGADSGGVCSGGDACSGDGIGSGGASLDAGTIGSWPVLPVLFPVWSGLSAASFSKGGFPISNPHHAVATIKAKALKPISQRSLGCCLASTGVGVFPISAGRVSCVAESDWRSGEPQRGQDLLFQLPRLEPHEVQYMFGYAEIWNQTDYAQYRTETGNLRGVFLYWLTQCQNLPTTIKRDFSQRFIWIDCNRMRYLSQKRQVIVGVAVEPALVEAVEIERN